MAKRIYVGNLPFSSTEDDVRNLFSEAGTVKSVSLISDKFSGRSRGFGFVEMANDAEADKAIAAMNGRIVGDRALVVNEARPMTERRDTGRDQSSYRSSGRREGGYRR
ncbi:MAG: RNA-binding protein [bacterium]|nr:RNA-binding protein [bacterium]